MGRRSSSADGVAGAVAQSRSPLAVSDARETPRFAREDAFIENEMVSAVSAPMIVHGGTLYGVLTVYAARPRVWHEDEVQALIALAATASAALSSADLSARGGGEGTKRGDPRAHRRRHRGDRSRGLHRPLERDGGAHHRRSRGRGARPPGGGGTPARARHERSGRARAARGLDRPRRQGRVAVPDGGRHARPRRLGSGAHLRLSATSRASVSSSR